MVMMGPQIEMATLKSLGIKFFSKEHLQEIIFCLILIISMLISL